MTTGYIPTFTSTAEFHRLTYAEELEAQSKIPGCEAERPIKETIRSVIRGCRAILQVQEHLKPPEENLHVVKELISDFCRKARNVEWRFIYHADQTRVPHPDFGGGPGIVIPFIIGPPYDRMGFACSSRNGPFLAVDEVVKAIKEAPIEDCYNWPQLVKAFVTIQRSIHPRGHSLVDRTFQIYHGPDPKTPEAILFRKFKQVMDTVSSTQIRTVEDLLTMERNFEAWWDGNGKLL